jgi:t-SNARE complex subunit (syntaxin)
MGWVNNYGERTPEKIIRKLRQAEVLSGQGKTVEKYVVNWVYQMQPVTNGARTMTAAWKRIRRARRDKSGYWKLLVLIP